MQRLLVPTYEDLLVQCQKGGMQIELGLSNKACRLLTSAYFQLSTALCT